MIKLRTGPAMTADLEEMQQLFSDTIASVCAGDYDSEQLRSWISSVENKDRWVDKITRQYFMIAETDRKIVGYGSLENGNYLDFMYVHKDYQGQGIATMILEGLEREARRTGVDVITSDVSITARPFFEKRGFLFVRDNINNVNGVEMVNFRMMKKL